MSLVESDALALDTTVRSVVLGDLPNVDEAVTIDHLLTHRSGVGDYLEEDADGDIDDHTLGQHFAFNNSGFVMLSLVIEAVTGS